MKNLIQKLPLNLLTKLTLLFCMALNPLASIAEEASNAGKAISVVTGKININSADANMIASTLKGVGLKKAMAIIEYRETYGDFKDIQELEAVSGIGGATIKKNAHLIAVN